MYQLNMTAYDRKVYQEELRDFLPAKILDCHTHIWLDSFTAAGDYNGGSTWTERVATELSAQALTDTYTQLFPDKTVTPLVFGGCLCDLQQVNDYVYENACRYGFPTLYRTDYSMSGEFLETQIKQGGFLGIKPYLTNVPPYLPVDEIRIFDFLPHEHLEVCDRNGWIVMLHIPRKLRLKDPVNLAQLLEIEQRYPNLKLIVAHVGRAYSRQDLGQAFDLLKDTKNMYFDFTANLCDDAIRACIQAVGTKRIMFGSDLPIAAMRMYRITDETGNYFNVVPRGMYADVRNDPHMLESDEENITLMIYEQLRALKRVAEDLELTKEQIGDIMYANAQCLIDAVAKKQV